MKSTIRLFKAVLINNKSTRASEQISRKTLQEGFLFSPEVIGNYADNELEALLETTKKELTLNSEQLNSAFHKSWQKVRDADIEQLVLEQIIHYFTTYGFEELGIYDKTSVYVPREVLSIPKVDIENLHLIIIKGYTKEELKQKLLALLQSGIALGEDTISDVVEVALSVGLSTEEIQAIKNKEVRALLYDLLRIVPENPTEFLRFAVYKATGKTLLIKSAAIIEEIKSSKNIDVSPLFMQYEQRYGLEKLAEIFYRFKPLFLAFKTIPQLATKINRISKLAHKHHKPMPVDYLNIITSEIKNGKNVDIERLSVELQKANTFRKIRLAYALKFRIHNTDAILYKIRNGKGYATEFSFAGKDKAQEVLDIVLHSIVEDVSKNIKGKKVYVPQNVIYALPATEKQFTGMLPSGTSIVIPRDLVVGVHWENVDGHRIDLDLSLLSVNAKYGWDASYRNSGGSILFSGDMTDAPKPHGASELFYIEEQEHNALLVMVNYFNFDENIEVPISIFAAHEKITQMKRNYMVNPNNVVAVAKSKINQKQKILGLIITTEEQCKFHFSEVYLGKSITSTNSEFATNARRYLVSYYENMISFNDVLLKAGAELVDDKDECDIDLSIDNASKDTIISLLV
jgi:hypothetical protein